ncbi:tein kinase 4-like protein [Colletotrichum sojae]|uniref:Tein kinase 4-like protein n=1 Tax=Colletotrichum sojae TaxID=2175907 RepID=A0A8H6J7K6_9PEZI|nr:tein kinase 4-like protein [Colletotrichum sojae]
MNDEDAIEQFRLFCKDYIRRHGCTGEDGDGAKRQFVSRKALTGYWTREKITTVLCSRDNLIIANSETILRHYSVVFSILVLMSRPEQIHLFTRADINDSKLPLLSAPPSYPNAPEATIIGDFMRNQWKFCPLTFGHTSGSFPDKRDISTHQILPIIEKEKLKPTADEEEDDSVLYKVKLHPDCTDISDYVAFKVYAREDNETEQFYENEASMYSHLSKESFDHIVTYRGSFRQSGKRTIVLQYALGDTLQAFFKNQSPPRRFADRVQFFSNLLDLLKGLHAIQDLTRNHHHSIATHRLKGTHQDIRPQNILVCGSLSENVYCAPFKVADLGKSHIRMVRNGGIDRAAVDQFGNGMYSAPEILRDNKTAIVVAAAADIWSFGGIVSEGLIWSIFGEEGRMEYQAERVAGTRETNLRGGNHEGAFHDGDCLLDVVRKWHEKAIQHQNGIENLTKELSDLILNRMLVPDPHHRASNAAEVYEYWIKIRQRYAPSTHDPQAYPAAATKLPARSQSTSHAVGRGRPTVHRPAMSDESPRFTTEIVSSPSSLSNGLSGHEQSLGAHNPTGLGIAGGVSSPGDNPGPRRLKDRTHFTNHHQPQPSVYRHHASPSASQAMPLETFRSDPPTQDPSVVLVETNAEGSNEVAEKCVTVDEIWETCFEGGGRIGKVLNKKTHNPLETFPSLEASLKKVKVAKGRDQVTLSSFIMLICQAYLARYFSSTTLCR